jgi:hypothetical protein
MLVFVYNATDTVFGMLSDFAHKMVSPETYTCNLCKITYGNFRMKHDWREFVEGLTMPVSFAYKNQFTRKYPELSQADFPAVFKLEQGFCPKEVISASLLNSFKTSQDLMDVISSLEQTQTKQQNNLKPHALAALDVARNLQP